MIDPTSLLTHPAPDAARALALHFIARIADARGALRENPFSEDAVHDARVAITRLRSTLRAYHETLDAGLSKRGRRALRQINRVLGRVRDLDVQRAWLQQHLDAMPELAQSGARSFLGHVERKREERSHRIDTVLSRYFDSSVEMWQHQLRHYKERRVVGEPVRHEPLAAVVVQQLHHAVHQFEHDIAAAIDEPSAERLHVARIAIKRIRAILVPWLDAAPAVRPLFDSLSAAQDALGNQRDAHLLALRVEQHAQRQKRDMEALLALAEYCEAEHARLGASVQSSWLADAGASIMQLVPPAASALSSIARADHEIERKFLLRAAPTRALELPGVRIAQGWLPGEILRERLRRSVYTDGRVEWTRTVKVGTGVSRIELEEATEPLLFESLWPLTAGARVEKVRYTVGDGAFTWEVDVFLDRELVLAEVELPSAETLVTLPEWLAPFVVRDVTGDAAYVNANLARDRRLPAPHQ